MDLPTPSALVSVPIDSLSLMDSASPVPKRATTVYHVPALGQTLPQNMTITTSAGIMAPEISA